MKKFVTLGGWCTMSMASIWGVCAGLLIYGIHSETSWAGDVRLVVVVLSSPLGLFGSLGVMGQSDVPIAIDLILLGMNFFLVGYSLAGLWRLLRFVQDTRQMTKAHSKSRSEHTVSIWGTILVMAFVCTLTMPISGGLEWFHLFVTFPSWIYGLMLYRSGPRRNSLGSILALIGIAVLTTVLGLNLANVLWFGHEALLR